MEDPTTSRYSVLTCGVFEYLNNENVLGSFPQADPLGLSYKQLGKSAGEGCSLCQLVFNQLPDPQLPDEDYLVSFTQNWPLGFFIGGPPELFDRNILFEFYRTIAKRTLLPECSPHVARHRGREIFRDPMSDSCREMARKWLEDCIASEEHVQCSPNTEEQLPSRVINVTGKSSDDVFLENFEGQKGSYTVLSHCWGTEPMFTTDSITLKDRQHRIYWSSLPRTFQDAIAFTRTLGVQYLWIDSLCILQDSREDWESESGKMSAYYSNAYLAISAIDSQNSLEGSPNLYVRLGTGHPGLALSKTVLNSRGWCLQERLLPTRVLHFGRNEMYWECMSSSTREGNDDFNNEVSRYGLLENSWGPRDDFKRMLSFVPHSPDPLNVMALMVWYAIVCQFSRRFLTYGSDKLPAIAGIASYMQERTSMNYQMGMWEQDMMRGILWYPHFEQEYWDLLAGIKLPSSSKKTERISKYPTWSWASRIGQVNYNKVFDWSNLIDHTPDHFPDFCGKSLRLEPTKASDCPPKLVLDVYCKRLRYRVITYTPNRNREYDLVDEEEEYIGIANFDFPDDEDENGTCTAIRIAKFPEKSEVLVLIVEPHPTEHNKWQRIGIGHLLLADGCPDFFYDCGYETINLI